jgi:hypothetical protein
MLDVKYISHMSLPIYFQHGMLGLVEAHVPNMPLQTCVI